MKSIILVVAAAMASVCAVAKAPPPPPKKFVCQTTPQWYTTDDKGNPSAAILVCFAEDHTLVWQSRPVTPEEAVRMVQPNPVPQKTMVKKK